MQGLKTDFPFTVSQQEFHNNMGFENQPVWCKDCKIKGDSQKQLPCFGYENGKCDRGDSCRFSHSDPKAPKSVFHTAVEDDQLDESEGFQVVRPSKSFVWDSMIQN